MPDTWTTYEIVVRKGRDRLGEGARWSVTDQSLMWVDILGQRINRLAADGTVDSWQLDDFVGWTIETRNGGIIAGVGRSVFRVSLSPLSLEPICKLEPEQEHNRVNDAKADPKGRIWAGTMATNCLDPSGALYRVDSNGRANCMVRPCTIPNGPAISPDGDWLLHTDTAVGTIFRYGITSAGNLRDREVFIQFEPEWGAPDGMTIDAEGCLWVACWGRGRVMRFDLTGKPIGIVELPATQITSCAFGGPDLDRLYVTSAYDGVTGPTDGSLFVVETGIRGIPAQLYVDDHFVR